MATPVGREWGSRTKEVPLPRGVRGRTAGAIRALGLASVLLLAANSTRAQGSSPAPGGPLAGPATNAPPATVAAPRPASGLLGTDVANDAGRAIDLEWKGSPDDVENGTIVTGYRLARATSPGGPWAVVDSTAAGTFAKTDQSLDRGVEHLYRHDDVGAGGLTPAGIGTGPIRATSAWITSTRWSVMAGTILFFGFVLLYMAMAQSGKKPFVRRIPGIDAIEEAIGRATEMGRSVLYVP